MKVIPIWRWIILSTLSVQGLYISPFYVGALVDKLEFTASQAGLISGGEYAAVALAGLFIFFMLDRLNWRNIIVLCSGSAAVANFLCVGNGDFSSVLMLRIIAGFCAGTLYSLAFALLARSTQPERSFGWSMTLVSILAAAYLLQLPYLIEQWGINAIYYLELFTILFCIGLAFGLQNKSSNEVSVTIKFQFHIFTTLSGLIFFNIAQGSLWAFVERIGHSGSISSETIGITLMIATIIGIGGGLASAVQGKKWGHLLPLVFVFVGQSLSVYFLWISTTPIVYLIFISFFNFLWIYAIAFQLGIIAEKDLSGRSCALATTFQALGLAFGAGIAGALFDINENFDLVYLLIFVCGGVSLWLLVKKNTVIIDDAEPIRTQG